MLRTAPLHRRTVGMRLSLALVFSDARCFPERERMWKWKAWKQSHQANILRRILFGNTCLERFIVSGFSFSPHSIVFDLLLGPMHSEVLRPVSVCECGNPSFVKLSSQLAERYLIWNFVSWQREPLELEATKCCFEVWDYLVFFFFFARYDILLLFVSFPTSR